MLKLPSSHQQPLFNQRHKQITNRCHYVLKRCGISKGHIRKSIRAMAQWFWLEKINPEAIKNSPDLSSPYVRPVSKTIWDERFDITTSIVNQPVTKQFLKFIGSKQELSDHRFYGYVAALALLHLMDGMMGVKPEDLDALENFGGPHEEGGADYTAFLIEDERNTMIENMLGKAEEFVFKSDAFTEQAEFGQKGKRQTEISWEPIVEQEIKLMVKNKEINTYRNKSGNNIGKIKITRLSDYLHTRIRSYNLKPLLKSEIQKDKPYCPRLFPSNPKTVARRLPEILARLKI